MQTNNFATAKAHSKPNWLQQLWQRIADPVSRSADSGQERSHHQTASSKTTRVKTRSPELAPPRSPMNSQTLEAFSDYADEDEPTMLSFAYLIPEELALLDASSSQDVASVHRLTTTKRDKPMSVGFTSDPAANRTSDDEYLLDLVPSELSELSVSVGKRDF